jgi:uncharacterized protein (UPF0248 family)
MESTTNSNAQGILYEKISNNWNIIFDYLDINSLFKVEGISKYFRNQISQYYESKESLIKINKVKTNEKEKSNHIKLFKQRFLSQYFNLLVHINITDNKFCNPNEKNELVKKSYPSIESNLFKNRILIEQVLIQDNKFLILYSNNTFSILEFNISDTQKQFKEILCHDFMDDIINSFSYYDSQNGVFFLNEKSTELFYLNIKEKSVKNFDLKKRFEFFNEEDLIIKKIFPFNDFILFLTNKEEFILIPYEQLGLFNKIKLNDDKKNKNLKEDKKSENSEDEKESTWKEEENKEIIAYPQKLEKTYGAIKHIYSNNSNVIILNNDYQIYSIPSSEYKNYSEKIPKFKLLSEQKFPNFSKICGGSNFFILLEKEKIKPLEEWSTEEIYKWFEEMELDDYLNIIKNQKITGKDIAQADKDYFIDFMGFEEDHLNKLNYEISALKLKSSKNAQLWGWGNNKSGQLGLMNNQTYAKTPTKINIPNMLPDDTIEEIYCGKTYTVLQTTFGNLFVTGNYLVKNQNNSNNNQSNNNNQNNNTNQNNNNKKNKGKNKHHKDEHKEKNKKNDKKKEKDKSKDNDNEINNNAAENKWVNISQDICYSSYNLFRGSNKNKKEDSFFKIKNIFCQDNNIFFIGFYSNKIPFFAIQKKPKFKHLKKGGKFITSDKVIELIQEFLKDKSSEYKVVYGDSLLKMLETNLDDYLVSEIPFHKIIQIKDNNEIIWDRRKRYFKENFVNENINKLNK